MSLPLTFAFVFLFLVLFPLLGSSELFNVISSFAQDSLCFCNLVLGALAPMLHATFNVKQEKPSARFCKKQDMQTKTKMPGRTESKYQFAGLSNVNNWP